MVEGTATTETKKKRCQDKKYTYVCQKERKRTYLVEGTTTTEPPKYKQNSEHSRQTLSSFFLEVVGDRKSL